MSFYSDDRATMSDNSWELWQLCTPVRKYASQNLADGEVIVIDNKGLSVFRAMVRTAPPSDFSES